MTRTAIFRTISLLTLAVLITTGVWLSTLFAASRPVGVSAVLGASTETSQAELLPYPVVVGTPSKPFINARHYVLYEATSGKPLIAEDAISPVPIASTTKLMTAYLAVQFAQMDSEVTVSKEGASQIGSLMGLRSNEKLTVESLVYGAMLVSGNDAAHMLAAHVGGILMKSPEAPEEARIARFVEEMNHTASVLGMSSTQYKDPAGLNDEGHSTALDLAKLASVALQHPLMKQVVGTANRAVTNISGTIKHDLRNSNRLVADYNYTGVVGGKTGFTPAAGHCLITMATRDGMTLIAVVLSTYQETKEASAVETRKLLDWGFANWRLE